MATHGAEETVVSRVGAYHLRSTTRVKRPKRISRAQRGREVDLQRLKVQLRGHRHEEPEPADVPADRRRALDEPQRRRLEVREHVAAHPEGECGRGLVLLQRQHGPAQVEAEDAGDRERGEVRVQAQVSARVKTPRHAERAERERHGRPDVHHRATHRRLHREHASRRRANLRGEPAPGERHGQRKEHAHRGAQLTGQARERGVWSALMSWGYFAELRVSMPTAQWRLLQKRPLAEFVLPAGWSGLKDKQLEASFLRPHSGKETLGKALGWKCYRGAEAVHQLEAGDELTSLRICLLLDKSQLELALPLAAVLEAARTSDATGSLRLVNDGTFSGEDGVEIAIAAGKRKTTRLKDCWELNEALAAELFEAIASKPQGKKPMINPFTGQPLRAEDLRPPKAKKAAVKARSTRG